MIYWVIILLKLLILELPNFAHFLGAIAFFFGYFLLSNPHCDLIQSQRARVESRQIKPSNPAPPPPLSLCLNMNYIFFIKSVKLYHCVIKSIIQRNQSLFSCCVTTCISSFHQAAPMVFCLHPSQPHFQKGGGLAKKKYFHIHLFMCELYTG